MNYLSVCSGIEAATVAWHDMGWNPVGFSEIEKFPSQLLAHHYPNVTNYGDMTKFKEWNINEPVNLLVGGTPCQSFSVAGLRKGLADPRGNLMLTYLAMADHFKPKWLLWENVPGVLSSNGGHDFSALLQGMVELGYGVAYRVLDAQHFGVPQRRRRVFVVGCLGDWRSAAKVLFESESLCGDITPSREKRKSSTSYTKTSFGGYSEGTGTLRASGGDLGGGSETLVAKSIAPYETSGTLLARDYKGIDSYDYSKMAVQTKVYETHPMDSRVKEMGDVCQTVTTRWGTGGGNIPLVQNIAHAFKVRGGCAGGGKGYLGSDNTAFTLSTVQDQQIAVACLGGQHPNAAIGENIAPTLTSAMGVGGGHVPLVNSMRVRRLTPMECERLQGFPDSYTNTPTSSDSTRYKALGNSMAVPVMRWIGNRINNV
jgi:DNA (cytosine-5)-methyltransferase 1